MSGQVVREPYAGGSPAVLVKDDPPIKNEHGPHRNADTVGMFNHVAAKLTESQDIQQQVLANSREQFLQSPTIANESRRATFAAMDNYENMGKKLFGNKEKMDQFLALLAFRVYDEVQRTKPLP